MASDQQQAHIPFNGKWDPTHDPLLLKKGDFQDITNLRYTDAGIKGVAGYSKINTVKIPGSEMIEKIDDPGVLPAGSGNSTAFNHDGSLLAVIHSSSPYATIYNTSDWSVLAGFSLPSYSMAVAFNTSGSLMAVGTTGSPYILIFNTSDWSRVPDPAVLPTDNIYGVQFSHNDAWLAITGCDSPYLTIYNTSDWSKVADPAVLPANTGWDLSFSHDDAMLVVGHNNAPGITIYNTSDWSKIADPADLPSTSGVRGVSFNHDSSLLAAVHNNSPYLFIYNTSDWSKVADPVATPTSTSYSVDFNPSGTLLAIAHGGGNRLFIYNTSDWSKVADPVATPTSTSYSVDFNNNSTLLAVAHMGSPYITIYGLSSPISAGYHLTKDNPQQTYALVQSITGPGETELFVNKTAIPDQGNFETDPLHTDASGSIVGRFSPAPQGNVIYCNGKESLIWGGEEHRCAGFINYDPAGSFSYDYSEQVSNTQDDAQNVAELHPVEIDADTKLLLHFDNNADDSSGSAHVVTANNITYSTTTKVFGTHSAVMNGTTGYFTIPDHADFDFSGGTFTLDARVYISNFLHEFMPPEPIYYQGTPIYSLDFTSGGIHEVVVGDTIEGETGGATAVIRNIFLASGSWVGGDAAGTFYLDQKTGTFQAETLKVGANLDVASIAGASALHGNNYIEIRIFPVSYYSGTVGVFIHECYRSGTDKISLYSRHGAVWEAAWYFITVVENGDDWYIFVNGVLEGYTSSAIRAENYVGNVEIGRDGSGYFFGAGFLDELRVSSVARNLTDFEPPTEAYSISSTAGYFNIGATRQLQAVKLYVKTANTETSSCSSYYWDGSQYVQVSNLSDGTADGGKSLVQTGIISFDSTVDIAKVKYHNGVILYWYKFYISSLSAGTEISYVTVDAPFQDIKNIWSGDYDIVASCKKWDGAKFIDYTLEVNDTITTTAAVLDDMPSSGYLLLGFVNPQQGFQVNFVTEKSNTNAAALTCYSFDGEGYVTVGTHTDWDGTSKDNKSFTQNGTISFKKLGRDEEFRQVVDGAGPFYYYKLQFSAVLDAEVEVFYIRGIPNPGTIEPHVFALEFQNRTLLCSGTTPESVKISASNSPDVYNGDDSIELYVGDSSKFIAGMGVYNRFGSSIYNFAILCKFSETWILDGYSPDTFKKKQLSGTSGCCAPETMVACNIGKVVGDEIPKNLVMWLSFDGPVYCDGGGVFPISGVEPYFDRSDSRCINYDYIDKACAAFDHVNKIYNLCIPSGATQTTNNVWLLYDCLRNKWSKKAPSAYPTCMFPTTDTHGARYTYLGFNDGYLRRDEHGTTFDGTAITQTVAFSDMLLTDSLWEEIRLDFIKLICIAKNTGAEVSISAYHRANGDSSWTALTSVPMWDSGKRVVKHLQRLNKIGVGHELKFEVSTSDKTDGFEPIALGMLYHPERINTTLGHGR